MTTVKEIPAKLVAELRAKTGAGMMDCKSALQETGGDLEKAVDILRKKGAAKADKRAGREASEGWIGSYVHFDGSVGVLVEVNCETDFVARNEEFQALVRNLTLQIAASKPSYVRREDVPKEVVEKELEIYRAQAKEMGKPPASWEKIAAGKLEKFYQDSCLLEQSFIKDPNLKVADILTQKIATIGENIGVRRFTRYQLGEEE